VLSTAARNNGRDPGQETIISRRQRDDSSCVVQSAPGRVGGGDRRALAGARNASRELFQVI